MYRCKQVKNQKQTKNRMNLKMITIKVVLIFGILTSFSACNGENKSKFINEFEPDKSQFKEFIEKLKDEGLTKNTFLTGDKIGEDELELFKLVNIKHIIGKLMWYILAGTVISSISYNYIINNFFHAVWCQFAEDTIDGSVKEVFYTGIDSKLTVFLTNKIAT